MGSISKSFLLLALLAAVVLLISSEVAARDLAETTTENNNGAVATETTQPELEAVIRSPCEYRLASDSASCSLSDNSSL